MRRGPLLQLEGKLKNIFLTNAWSKALPNSFRFFNRSLSYSQIPTGLVCAAHGTSYMQPLKRPRDLNFQDIEVKFFWRVKEAQAQLFYFINIFIIQKTKKGLGQKQV